MRYFFYDTETGGNHTGVSLLTLSGIILDENLNELDDIDLKIKPNDGIYKVEAEALAINGINLVEHDKEAITEREAAAHLRAFLWDWSYERGSKDPKPKITVGGWNTYWDNAFVEKYLLPDFNDLISRHLFDAASIAVLLKNMGLLPRDFHISLKNLAKHYNVEFVKNAHDAKSDITATVAVVKCMLKQLSPGNH